MEVGKEYGINSGTVEQHFPIIFNTNCTFSFASEWVVDLRNFPRFIEAVPKLFVKVIVGVVVSTDQVPKNHAFVLQANPDILYTVQFMVMA